MWVLWVYTQTSSTAISQRPQTGEGLSVTPHSSFITHSLEIKRDVFESPCTGKTLKAVPTSHQISMTSNLLSLWEKHTPHSIPAAVDGFAKKPAGAHQTEPRLPYKPIAVSQTGFKTNQTAKQHPRKSLPLSVSPLLSQKRFTPPKNRVFLHGWFEEAQVCCVFRANVCAWARGNSGNHHPK